MIAASRSYVRAHGASATATKDGEAFNVCPTDGAETYLLEGPAALMWRMLEEPRTLAWLLEELDESYIGDSAKMRTQTIEFLDAMVAAGVLEHPDKPGAENVARFP